MPTHKFITVFLANQQRHRVNPSECEDLGLEYGGLAAIVSLYPQLPTLMERIWRHMPQVVVTKGYDNQDASAPPKVEWVQRPFIPAFRALRRDPDGLFFATVSPAIGAKPEVHVEVTEDEIRTLLNLCNYDEETQQKVLGLAQPPVVASQADIARFLGRSENTTGLLETLKQQGIIKWFEKGERRKFKVWFADPDMHARALKEIPK